MRERIAYTTPVAGSHPVLSILQQIPAGWHGSLDNRAAFLAGHLLIEGDVTDGEQP
jgi:hypothetical protein